MSLAQVAEDYFSQINSTAKRLCQDMCETKSAYEDLWPTLSEGEKADILDETIIKPEACLQYSYISPATSKPVDFAAKTIVDDNYSFRDEHSAPFSFRTPSQRDLRLFATADKTRRNPHVLKPKEEIPTTLLQEVTDSTSGLPKTGLDLLDNW